MTKTMGARRAIGAAMIGLSAFALAACGGGKPSEGDLKDKLVELYTKSDVIPKEQAEQLAECMSPKMLEDVSEDGLEAIMDAEGEDVVTSGGDKISQEDNDALTKIGTDCAGEMSGS